MRVNSYYSCDADAIKNWLALLPIKLLVHREWTQLTSYNQDALEKLKNHWEILPIHMIKEQEYSLFEI